MQKAGQDVDLVIVIYLCQPKGHHSNNENLLALVQALVSYVLLKFTHIPPDC